jgi:hypothetical protein
MNDYIIAYQNEWECEFFHKCDGNMNGKNLIDTWKQYLCKLSEQSFRHNYG